MTEPSRPLRDLRDVPLKDLPPARVAEVVRRIVGAEPSGVEVAAFNSSI